MAIARPASPAIAPPAVVQRPVAPAHAPAGQAGTAIDGAAASTTASHIRRCTFRRVTALPHGRRELPMYDVDCLHPSYAAAIPLGHLEVARAACAACTLPGIFRADED